MELQTDRLVLRRWRTEDRAPYAEICADPEVMRYIADGSTLTPDQATAQIERFEQHWEEVGYGLWAVRTRADGAFVGFAGLARPFFLPEVMPAVELGWRFGRNHWGRGYATETGAATLRFGFSTVGLDRIIGIVSEANAASRHVMEKLGFTLERTTALAERDIALRVYEKAAPAAA